MMSLQEARNEQIKLVGSKEVYDNLSQCMVIQELDPIFLSRQMKIFVWRYKLLRKYFDLTFEQLSFISSMYLDLPRFHFEQNLDKNCIYKLRVRSYIRKRAKARFGIPLQILFLLMKCHPDPPTIGSSCPCVCGECSEIQKTLQNTVKEYPEAADVMKKVIENDSFHFYLNLRLEDACKVKVLELGLDLPDGVRDDLKTWTPKPRRLSPQGEVMMVNLERAVKKAEDNVNVP